MTAERMSAEELCSADLIPLLNKARSVFLNVIDPVCREVDDLDVALRAYDDSLATSGLVLVSRSHIATLQSEAEAERALADAMREALEYALPIVEKYAHTQGDNAEFHGAITAPIRAALSQARGEPSLSSEETKS